MAVISKFYNIIAKDDVIFIPDFVLAKCHNVDGMLMSADNLIEMPEVTVNILHLVQSCIQSRGVLNGISWADIKDLTKAAKYLGCGDVFDALGKLVMCLIRGNQYEIRRTFSFEPIEFYFDDGDWEIDPIDSLDSNNFIFNLFPLEVIIDILVRLPKKKRKPFYTHLGKIVPHSVFCSIVDTHGTSTNEFYFELSIFQ